VNKQAQVFVGTWDRFAYVSGRRGGVEHAPIANLALTELMYWSKGVRKRVVLESESGSL